MKLRLAVPPARSDSQPIRIDLPAGRRPGGALVLWSPDNKVMPPQHGRRLAALIPRARYAEIPGAYVLSMLDEPEAVAQEMGAFLTSAENARYYVRSPEYRKT